MTWFINTDYYEKVADKFYEKYDKGTRTMDEWEDSFVQISEKDLDRLADGLKHAVGHIKFLSEELHRHRKLLKDSDSIEAHTQALEIHHKQVVRPVNEYCQAFYDWRDTIAVKVTELKENIETNTPELEKLFPEGVPENLRDYVDEKSDRIRLWYSVWNDKSDLERWEKCLNALNDLYLFIVKSDYLRRRIYAKERHRTEKCPVHKGHWSGLRWPTDPPVEGCLCQEPDGNVSGWIPLDE